jgi:Tol biopolymer transport system component
LLAFASALSLALTRRAPEVQLGKRVQLTLDPGLEIDPALSPDGKLAAYAAGPLGATRLYVRQVDGGAPVAITAEGGFARMPRWSPDGSRLLFRSNRGLEVIPALGGAPQLLVAAPSEAPLGFWHDATWSPDGRSIAYVAQDSILVRSLDGGAVRGLARLGEAHSCVWSPNGRWLACVSGNRQFVSNEGFGNIAASSIWIIPAAGGTPVRVTDDQSLNISPAWLGGRPSLLFISDRDGGRDLHRVALDHSGHVSGAPTRLTTGLNAVTANVSTDGRRLAYAVFTESSNVWVLPIPTSTVASVREAEPVTTGSQVIEDFDVAPGGGWLAFDSDRGGTQQIYRLPLAGGEVQQLTSGAEPAFAPRISPDGKEIAYHAFRQGTRQVFVIPAEGGTPTAVTTGNQHHRNARWSPDGRRLMILTGDPTASQETDVVLRDRKGRWSAPRTLVKGGGGGWSPDGRSIVTLMTVGDERGLALMSTVGGPPRMLIPVASAAAAPITGDWSSDGRFLYYMLRDTQGQGTGIWRMPASGGTPGLVLRLDDPSRPWHRNGFRVHDRRFYFTLGDQQSDVWTTELVSAP